ncbi:MAG: sister chromatid cohesion protein PDS5, partial [Bacteroidota bacterium]
MKATSSEGDVKREAAVIQQDTKHTAHTSLSTAVQYGFRIAPIDKDGNCLFRAIAEQLQRSPWNIRFPSSDDYYNSLRKIAVEHVRTYNQKYSSSFPNDTFRNVEDWMAQMSQDKTWGGEIAIRALCDALQITIVIIRAEASQHERPAVYKPTRYQPARIVYLYYREGAHYESLYRDAKLVPVYDLEGWIKQQVASHSFTPPTLPDVQALVTATAKKQAKVPHPIRIKPLSRFEKLESVIDRDLGIHAGNSDIIQTLVKAGLKKDYEAQLAQLKSKLNSASYYARLKAVEAMGKLVQDACFLAPEMLETLLQATRDPEYNVREAAASALREIAKASPSLATKTLEALLKAAEDSDKWVRSGAASALGELAKVAPSHAPKVLEALLKAAGDSRNDYFGNA